MARTSGGPDSSQLDLGDGWTRCTQRVAGKTAVMELRRDHDGTIVDVRLPPKFPGLPSGKEHEAFSAVLEEMRSRGAESLRKIPVYYVNRNTRGYAVPTHGYVVAGDPGKGRKSGAVLYGVGGDPLRGPVALDETSMKRLLSKMRQAGDQRYPEHVRQVVAQLARERFASREDFYTAYRLARGETVDPADIHKEVMSIYRLLPMHTMELWPKKSGDFRVEKPPAPERDLRAFESPPKELGRKAYFKEITGAGSLDLMHARQQFLLHQLYQDELMGRDGSGVPSEERPPIADTEQRHALSASTPRFQRLPPHASDMVGNCNTGAASLLQRAMDSQNDTADRTKPAQASAASIFGLGSSHRISLWDPLTARRED
ncbi:hypothetical protein SAMN04489710_11116 [Paracidovorax konjaci]|uniref:Uncharacterized protein n=2 Tax=Paracidovorax konjaci TaxID=32040 RepID=A0A1I1WU81_9BURK|nr:hypothetical protein SAMN04489710_11116 [Paracidovorax konjaci]